MPHIETSEGTIFFSDHRRDELAHLPLVLVHGAGGSRLDWPGELRRLPAANAIALDLPGHGKSPGPGCKSVEAYAKVIIAFMDALELPQVYLMGHSMGGAIAQQMALDYAGRVAGLILIGTGAKLRVHPDILDRIKTDKEAVANLLADWFWSGSKPEASRNGTYESNMDADTEVLYHDYAACNVFDIRDRLGEIRVPVLVISGTEDRMTALNYGEYLRDNLPDAELVVVEGGGHMMALEQPDVVTDAVKDWLDAQHEQAGDG